MKAVSFFSAKGGTGKTTFNMLFASYLHYSLGKRVLYLDFDGPEYNAYFTRLRELPDDGDKPAASAFYPIEQVKERSVQSIRALADRLNNLSGYLDYVMMDFAGSFEPTDPVVQLAKARVLNHIVIPMEIDRMILSSAKSLAKAFSMMGQKPLLFYNRVSASDAPGLFEDLDSMFESTGLSVSKHRIKAAKAMTRESNSSKTFLRSSVCFPKAVQKNNPAIIGLFDEIIALD